MFDEEVTELQTSIGMTIASPIYFIISLLSQLSIRGKFTFLSFVPAVLSVEKEVYPHCNSEYVGSHTESAAGLFSLKQELTVLFNYSNVFDFLFYSSLSIMFLCLYVIIQQQNCSLSVPPSSKNQESIF